jgi:hypothetical protein
VKYLHNCSALLGPLDDLYTYFPNAIIVWYLSYYWNKNK